MATAENFLDRYLDPVTQALSPDVARTILDLAPDDEIQARVLELGEKANAGTLSASEQDEYHALADAGTLVALIKAKARRFLAERSV